MIGPDSDIPDADTYGRSLPGRATDAGFVPGPERETGAAFALQLGPLPEAVAALLRTQVSINRILVEAFEERSRDKLLQALLLDPTTHSYRQSVELVERFFEVQGDVLPPLEWD